MNLYTNIKFSNNLIGNKICTITYSGYLYENNSQTVRIVYGYGNDWQHTTEQLMEKTEHGFEAQINVLDYDTFNFCFRNEIYEWDNNYNQNYSASISKEIPQEEVEENFIINENVLPEILDTLSSIDLSSTTQERLSNQELENIKKQNISKEPMEPISFEVFIEKNEPINIEDTLVNSVEVASLNQNLDILFNDLYSALSTENDITISTENKIETTEIAHTEVEHFNVETQSSEEVTENNEVTFDDIIYNNFDMNNLIDEILSPIVKSSVFEEDSVNSLNTFTSDTNNDNLFDAFQENDDDIAVDSKIDNLIADLFNNTKEYSKQIESQEINQVTTNIEVHNEPIPSLCEEKITTENEKAVTLENIQEVESNIDTNENIIETTSSEDSFEESVSLIENEDSLINSLDESTSLIEIPNNNDFVVSPRSLGKFYMFRKKIKLAFAKLFSLSKLFGRNFNRGTN